MLTLVEAIHSQIKSGALSETHGPVSRRAVMLVFRDEIMEARRAGLTVKAIRLAMLERTIGVPCYERFLFYVRSWEEELGLRPSKPRRAAKTRPTSPAPVLPTADTVPPAVTVAATGNGQPRKGSSFRLLTKEEILSGELETDRCE